MREPLKTAQFRIERNGPGRRRTDHEAATPRPAVPGEGVDFTDPDVLSGAAPRPAGVLHDPRNVDGCPLCPCTEPGK